MAENDSEVNGGSIGEGPTLAPKPSHGGRRFAAGNVILGRYVVESELGQGGMGVVYKCLDRVGGVKVAVKGLPPDVAHNEGEMEEIRANFQLVCDLRHENIAGVRTLEKDASGDYYLVMDLAHGEDLGTWMRKNKDADLKARLSIVRQIASALDYAHRRKVMHRDIKPGNVMVSPSGRVLLLDFGLAAQISTSLSRTSHMVVSQSGTPAYKSPEQWRGRPQGAEADQYALAVVAYRLLSGRLPFDGDNVLVLCRAVLEEKPPAIKWLPSHANKALARALAKDPHDRFPTCTAFADALEGKSSAGSFPRLLFVSLLSASVLLAACGLWLHFEKKEQSGIVDSPLVDMEFIKATNRLTVAVGNRDELCKSAEKFRRSPRGFSAKLGLIDEVCGAKINAGGKLSKQDAEKALAAVSNEVDVLESAISWMFQNREKRDAVVKKEVEFEEFLKVEKEKDPDLFSRAERHPRWADSQKVFKGAQKWIDDGAFDLAASEIDKARRNVESILREVKSPPPSPPTIEQKNADRARLKAKEEQKKALDAGFNIQNDDYQAACRRMAVAEDLYKKGNYKQAESAFALAAEQFSATYRKRATSGTQLTDGNKVTSGGDKTTTGVDLPSPADGKGTAGNDKAPVGSGRITAGAKTATDRGQTTNTSVKTAVDIQVAQPTIEQKKADWARSKAVEEQKKAKEARIDGSDPDGWQAACDRMQDAEQSYRNGEFKMAERRFNKAAMAFEKMLEKTKPNGQKE
ncbi:MAG: protein kinase [Kiritimatiellae bacterium]|nr:protein kinase [Kiritimatiellia bacterium]